MSRCSFGMCSVSTVVLMIVGFYATVSVAQMCAGVEHYSMTSSSSPTFNVTLENDGAVCDYLFTAEVGNVIELTLALPDFFSLHTHVALYDGGDATAPSLGRMFFWNLPNGTGVAVSSSNVLFARLNVRITNERPNMVMEFSAQEISISNPVYCASSRSVFVPLGGSSILRSAKYPLAPAVPFYRAGTCAWKVNSTSADVFFTFNVQACPVLDRGDAVTVYDGRDASAPILGIITGGTDNGCYIRPSTSNVVYVVLSAQPGGKFGLPGLALNVTAMPIMRCSASAPVNTIAAFSGTIVFPAASAYIPDTTCTWTLQLSAAVSNVSCLLSAMKIPSSDRLVIMDGAYLAYDSWSGVPYTSFALYTNSPQVTITLTSANLTTHWNQGFTLTYAGLTVSPIPCGGTVYYGATSGSFVSTTNVPTSGYRIPNLLSCTFVVTAPGTRTAKIIIAAGVGLRPGDVLQVLDVDPVTNATTPIHTMTAGIEPWDYYTSKDRTLMVRYQTGTSNTSAPGFSATYTTTTQVPPLYCSGVVNFNQSNGNFFNLTNSYLTGAPLARSLNCTWVWTYQVPNPLNMNRLRYSLLSGRDFLAVYNGPVDPSLLLMNITGVGQLQDPSGVRAYTTMTMVLTTSADVDPVRGNYAIGVVYQSQSSGGGPRMCTSDQITSFTASQYAVSYDSMYVGSTCTWSFQNFGATVYTFVVTGTLTDLTNTNFIAQLDGENVLRPGESSVMISVTPNSQLFISVSLKPSVEPNAWGWSLTQAPYSQLPLYCDPYTDTLLPRGAQTIQLTKNPLLSPTLRYTSGITCMQVFRTASQKYGFTMTAGVLDLTGDATLDLYDGVGTSGRRLAHWDYLTPLVPFYTPTHIFTLVFKGPTNNITSPMGIGYRFTVTNTFKSEVCSGLQTLFANQMRGPHAFASTSPGRDTVHAYPTISCDFLLAPPGGGAGTVELTSVYTSLALGDALLAFDGVSSSAPLLANYTGSLPNTPISIRSTGNRMLVRMYIASAIGATQNNVAGINVHWTAHEPTITCQGIMSLPGMTRVQIPRDYTWSVAQPAANYPGGLNCMWKLDDPPVGFGVSLMMQYKLAPGDALTIEDNGQTVFYADSTSSLTQYQYDASCSGLIVKFVTRNDGLVHVGGMSLSPIWTPLPGGFTDTCRLRFPSLDLSCYAGTSLIPSSTALQRFANCSIFAGDVGFGYDYAEGPGQDNGALPFATVITGSLLYASTHLRPPPYVQLPLLAAAGNLYICGTVEGGFFQQGGVTGSQFTGSVRAMPFPSLVWAGQVVQRCEFVTGIYLPALRWTSYAVFVASASAPSFSPVAPVLEAIEYGLVLNGPVTDYSFPVLKSLANVSVIGTHLIEWRDVPITRAFAMNFDDNTRMTNLNLSTLTSLDVCPGPGIYSLLVNLPLEEFVAPNLYEGSLYITNTKLSAMSFPAFSQGSIISAANTFLVQFDVPNWGYAYYFTMDRSKLQSLNVPQLARIGTFNVLSNANLEYLDVCNLITVSITSFSANQRLSCVNTQEVAFDFAPSLSILSSDGACSPDIGKFGCSGDYSLFVNTTVCGYKLSCIQSAITQLISGRGMTVLVPAGTYTGCSSAPLSTMGKAFTLLGAGEGQTVIDCQGQGRALLINQLEGADTVIAGITFMNGTATSGGLVMIDGASPTFMNCSFDRGQASLYGGAIYITGTGAPSFHNVSVSGCRATSGGGVAVIGGTMSLIGGSISSCTAQENAGGLYLSLATNPQPLLQDTMFRENTAQRGGGAYADGPVIAADVTFLNNRASQFGGGFAAAPEEDLGTWYNFTRCTFDANTAAGGGGLFGFSGNLRLYSPVFVNNLATLNGGGALTATCSANYRLLCFITTACDVHVMVENGIFQKNGAQGSHGNGGAISVTSAILDIKNSFLKGNSAVDGGAIYTSVTIMRAYNLTLTSNVATAHGGAVYCDSSSGECTMTASQLDLNCATTAGGGLFLCTAACANSTGGFTDTPDPRLTTANLYSMNVYGAVGYGPEWATDPSRLEWNTAPDTSFISGHNVRSDDDALNVSITDGFGQSVITADTALLTLSLSVLDYDTRETVKDVTVGGSQTVIANQAIATFSNVALIATNITALGRKFFLACRLSEIAAVTLEWEVTLEPCALGQGRSGINASFTCDACAAGLYSDISTEYVCTACPGGSYENGGACTLCPVGFYSGGGVAACLPCADGYEATSPGTVQCTAIPAASTLSTATVAGAAAGAVAGIIVCIVIIALLVYRAVRRRTLQKYYLDNDATVRTGVTESPLQKEVKRLILANNTTRIGGGLYSNVYKAKYENTWIALKVIKGEMATDGTAQQEFRREAVALSRLEDRHHPGIVRLMFFVSFNPMCIGVEFLEGGSLKRAIALGQFTSVHDKVRLATECASGMSVIHACNIVHLDIKTDNMLLTPEGHLVIADFGIAKALYAGSSTNDAVGEHEADLVPNEYVRGQHSSQRSTGSLGGASGQMSGVDSRRGSVHVVTSTEAHSTAFTPQYVDPIRILVDKNNDDDYLKTADVFSYGIMMWAIYSESEPYQGESASDLVDKLKANPRLRPPPLINNCPAFYADIMNRCWHENPRMRPTFTEVFDLLKMNLRDMYGVQLPPGYASPDARLIEIDGGASATKSRAGSHGAHGSGPGPELQTMAMASKGSSSGLGSANLGSSMPPPPPPMLHEGGAPPPLLPE